MIPLSIHMDGDNAWPDLKETGFEEGDFSSVAILDRGLVSGLPSVALRIALPDGRTVIAQTTARLFCTAARAFMAKYPDLFEDGSS